MLTTFRRFIGLCSVNLLYMVLTDKKLIEPGPETSVYRGVTPSFLFFLTLFCGIFSNRNPCSCMLQETTLKSSNFEVFKVPHMCYKKLQALRF